MMTDQEFEVMVRALGYRPTLEQLGWMRAGFNMPRVESADELARDRLGRWLVGHHWRFHLGAIEPTDGPPWIIELNEGYDYDSYHMFSGEHPTDLAAAINAAIDAAEKEGHK